MLKAMTTIGGVAVLALGAAALSVPGHDGQTGDGATNTTVTTRPAARNLTHEPGMVPGLQLRDPNADKRMIDLTRYYTLALNEDASGVYGYTLAVLPRGVQKLQNVEYDLRGIVQVSGQVFAQRKQVFPEAVKGIKVGLKCRTLNFLHASRWTEADGKTIGRYVIHYADGQTRQVPIVFGVDLRDWLPSWDAHAAAKDPPVGWHGRDGKLDIVLFEKQWPNPLPDAEISSIDLLSSMTDAAPFLVALTAE